MFSRIQAIILQIFLLMVSFGCGRELKEPWAAEDVRPEKSQSSLQSCQEISIPKDLALNGHFLYHYPRCLQDQANSQSIAGLLELQDQMGGESALESVAEVMRFETVGEDGKKNRPLVKLFALTHHQEQMSLWDSLVSLSSHLYPKTLANWIYQQANSGDLERWLEEVIPFSQETNWSLISAEMRGLLSTSELRLEIMAYLKALFASENYGALAQWLRPATTRTSLREGRSDTLRSWLDPVAARELPLENALPLIGQADERKSGGQRLHEFWEKLDEKQREQFNGVASQAWAVSSRWPEERLKNVFEKSWNAMEKVFQRQANPLGHGLGLFHLARSTTVGEVAPLLKALADLIEQPSAMVPLNKKLASHDLAQLVLSAWEKRPSDLCVGVELPDFKDTRNATELKKNLLSWLTPYEQCPYGLSPLSSLLQSYLDNQLNCSAIAKLNEDDQDRFCLSSEEWKELAANERRMMASLPSFLNHTAGSEQARLNLLRYLWAQWESELHDNPWALHSLNLGLGPVSAKQWEKMGQEIEQTRGDLELLAVLQQRWEQGEYPQLGQQFLERFIRYGLNQVSAGLYGIEKFWGNSADQSFFPQSLGLSVDGFWSQAVGQYLTGAKIPLELKQSFPGPQRELDDVLSRARVSGAIFKDFSMGADDREVDFKYLGQSKLSVSFRSFQGTDFIGLNYGKVPLKIDNILNLEKGGMGRPSLLLKGDLVTRDIPGDGGAAQQSTLWFGTQLLPALTIADYWTERWPKAKMLQLGPEAVAGGDRSSLSTWEIRSMLFLMLRSYIVAPNFLPEKSFFELAKSEAIKKQFLSWPSFKNFAQTYRQLFPRTLTGADREQTPSELFSLAWQIRSWEEYHSLFTPALWPSAGPLEVDAWPASLELKETAKLLGAIHLLTSNKAEHLQPVIGDRLWCWNENQLAEDCPIIMAGESDSIKYEKLTNFVRDNFLLSFCPLFESAQSGDEQTLQLIESAQLNLNDPNLSNLCQRAQVNLLDQAYAIRGTKKELVFEKKNQIPLRSLLFQLNHAIAWGDRPTLHPALQSLSFDLAWPRMNQPSVRSMSQLSLPFLFGQSEAKFQRLIAENQGFYAGLPDMLGQLVATQGAMFPHPGVWQNRLNRVGAGVGGSGDPNQGRIYRLIREMVLLPAEDPSRQGESVLSFMLSRLSYLSSNADSSKILVGMLDRQLDYEALESFCKAITLYIRSFEFDFDWSRKELFFLKQVLRRDLQRTSVDVLSSFQTPELIDVVDLLGQVGAQLKQQMGTGWDALADLIFEQSFSGEQDLFVLEGQAIFRKLIVEPTLGQSLSSSMARIISFSLRPQLDFSGQQQVQGLAKAKLMVDMASAHMPRMVEHYATSQSEDDLFRKLVEENLFPLGKADLQQDLDQLVSFATGVELPSVPRVWAKILQSGGLRRAMSQSAQAMDRISLELALRALQSSQSLLQKTKKVLSFLQSKLQWSPTSAQEISQGLEQLVWLAGDGQSVLDRQIQILEKWGSVNRQSVAK